MLRHDINSENFFVKHFLRNSMILFLVQVNSVGWSCVFVGGGVGHEVQILQDLGHWLVTYLKYLEEFLQYPDNFQLLHIFLKSVQSAKNICII